MGINVVANHSLHGSPLVRRAWDKERANDNSDRGGKCCCCAPSESEATQATALVSPSQESQQRSCEEGKKNGQVAKSS